MAKKSCMRDGPMPKPLVSVTVLNYNGKRFLKDCPQSLREQSYPNYEVVLVDNASSDGSVQFVKENFPEVAIIQNKEPLGFARGNNVGMQHALSKGAKYVALLNNDTVVESNWLEELVKGIESEPNVAFCSSKILWIKDPRFLQGHADYRDIFGYPVALRTERFHGSEVFEVFCVPGVSTLVKSEVIRTIGYYDSKLWPGGPEDLDWGWRARLAGYKSVVNPKSVVYHYGGTEPPPTTAWTVEKRSWAERNTLRILIKNYSATTLIWLLPLYFSLLGMEILFFAFIDSRISLLYLKGIFWNIKHLGDTLRLRRKVQKMRKVSDKELLKHMYKGIGKIRQAKLLGIPKWG